MAQLTSISRSERTRGGGGGSNNRDDWTLPAVDAIHSGTSASYIDGSVDNPRYKNLKLQSHSSAIPTSITTNSSNSSHSSQRSPKRHSPSMYERVKSKVSRSLSNGSVVQKLAAGGIDPVTRPTSLIVGDMSQVVDESLWSCDNCTLDNEPGLEQCEACEAPRSPAPCSGVVISVPAWEPRALSSAGPLSYRWVKHWKLLCK